MKHVERRHVVTLAGPPERVFPLFTPRGESLWVEGWDPTYLHPENGETQAGMVFRTDAHAETTLWSCIDWHPEVLRVRYARVTPASRFGTVEVTCRASGEDRCEANVVYVFTALTPEGEDYLDGFGEATFAAMIEDWRERIDAYLATAPA